MRKAFNFYQSHWEQLKKMNDKQKLSIFNAICKVQFLEKHIDDVVFEDMLTDIVWTGIKHSLNTSLSGFINKQKSLNKEINIPLSKGGKTPPMAQEKEKEKEKGKEKEKEEEEKHNVDCDVLEVYEAYKNNIKAAKSKQSSLNNIKAWLKEYDKKILIQAIDNYKFVADKQEEKIYIKDCSNFFGVKNESKGYFVDFIERNINAEETNITILKPFSSYKQKPNGQAPNGFKIKEILDGMYNIEGYKIVEDKKDFLI